MFDCERYCALLIDSKKLGKEKYNITPITQQYFGIESYTKNFLYEEPSSWGVDLCVIINASGSFSFRLSLLSMTDLIDLISCWKILAVKF